MKKKKTNKKSKKKKTKRSQAKYPALNPKFMPKVRREYMDYDYIDKLSDEDKAFLNKFTEEELNASFKNDERDLNQTKEEKRTIYGRNNARNRDLYSISKASGLVEDASEDTRADIKINHSESYNLFEDALIAELDAKKEEE